MLNTKRYEIFQVKDDATLRCNVFILDQVTGDIFSFYKDYSKRPPGFIAKKVSSVKESD